MNFEQLAARLDGTAQRQLDVARRELHRATAHLQQARSRNGGAGDA
jgi:hypothetical protein